MEFDLQWLLLALPLTFALGWFASRTDLRHWRRDQRDTQQTFFKGLNLLLNEQHDKAIDAFLEGVQQDPGVTDLHFALGNLFRRRAEYERAVRIHQHLLKRADLSAVDRARAQSALAQDFMRAGLFDRAEEAFRALAGTVFDTDAQLALLTLHEHSRAWRESIEVAQKLERSGAGSFASRISHYWCEISEEADVNQQPAVADDALRQARLAAPHATRPLILLGRRLAQQGDYTQALQTFSSLATEHTGHFALIALEYADCALACNAQEVALQRLTKLYQQSPSVGLLSAIAALDADTVRQRERVFKHLREQPSLSVAQLLLNDADAGQALCSAEALASLRNAIDRAAKPLQRYRCAACGFETQRWFWRCPGCMAWDSYPLQRLEDLE